MRRNGARILLDCLKHEGVDTIFGYPGGAVLPIYDELYDCDIRHILARHEQGAVHAADGYARASGRVGVCLATSGPGATNLVTGIATAYMDSVPMVCLTGQVPTAMLGTDAFQEADITGITMSITKHTYLVNDINELPRIVHEAFHIASTGRPGPVLIDLPKDVMSAEADLEPSTKIDIPGYKPNYEGHHVQIKNAAHALLKAQKPVIYAGGGIIASGAEDLLYKFAKLLHIPVATTLMGMSVFPGTDDLSLGMLGMHGTEYANYAVHGCDLLIAIGARFSDRVTGKKSEFAKGAKIIHIDVDPAEVGKNVKISIPIVGDVKKVLDVLITMLEDMDKPDYSEWLDKIREWKKDHPLAYGDPVETDGLMKPQFVIDRLYRMTKGEAIVATDVGQHQMWTAHFYKFTHPRHFISSGGLGTMGFGFPAAIGSQVAVPDATVIAVCGDGSFQMNLQELGTVKEYNIPVKIAILNNGYLGMVRQWQDMFYDKRYSYTRLNCTPDFVKLAQAYGIDSGKATTPEEADKLIAQALACDGPFLMEFMVAQEENVLPMVPAGGGIQQMIGGRHK